MNKETKKLLEELNIEAYGESEEKNELEELRREKTLHDNVKSELAELYELFPDIKIEDIPDEVWEKCPDGKGLCAEVALAYRREELKAQNATAKNEQNSTTAPPNVKNEVEEVYFTPEAVKKMTPAEIENNYSAILESMKKWK
jgi:hypothetical protein